MISRTVRRKSPFLALALTLGLTVSSCLGPFNAWHQVLHWNRSVSDSKWVGEAIFIGLVIIPIYPLAFIADAIVFNSVEFWTGKNWIAPAPYSNTGTLESGAGAVETNPSAVEVAPAPAGN